MAELEDGASLRLDLASELSQIGEVRRQVDAMLRRYEAPARTVYGAALCLEEVLTNVIQHGYQGRPGQPITVSLERADDGFRLIVEDEAPAFDPTTVPPPPDAASIDVAAVGGRGMAMVRQYARAIRYRRDGARNRLEIDLAG